MDQLLTMQHSQRWQQLPHQQQHLSRAEHQLALKALRLDLAQS